MGFNLSRPAREIHAEVEVVIDDEPCRIMGVFTPLATNAAIDGFIRTLRTLEAQFEASPEFGLYKTIEDLASQVFVGWVNPHHRDDLWVVSDGHRVDCTPELRTAFLATPGVALAICQQYVNVIANKGAAMGNSERSPVSTSPPTAEPPNPTS